MYFVAFCLQTCPSMKQDIRKRASLVAGVTVMFCLVISLSPLAATPAFIQKPNTRDGIPAAHKREVTAFEERVKAYVKLRERLEAKKLPKLSKDATPEQIEAHKTAFQAIVRAARSRAKHGDVFTPDVAAYIRATIKNEFKGGERVELRETVLKESDTKAVPVRVNYPYPETQEQLEMPPTLLLQLPQLPKQVRYRFVGRNMLLVDRENGLIIDYMTNALP